MRVVVSVIVLMMVAGPAAAQGTYRTPRNAFAQPDLEGIWNFSSDVPLERAKASADREFFTREELEKIKAARVATLATFEKLAPVEVLDPEWLDFEAKVENLRTSLIIYPKNGRVPAPLPGLQRSNPLQAINDVKGTRPVRFLFGGIGKDAADDRGLNERCMASANTRPPYVPGFDNNNVQIVQGVGHVVLRGDDINALRIVPLDQRPRLRESLRSWTGDSRGYWDRDTLVVETRNFNGRTQSFGDAGTSLDLVVTERFTRIAPNVIQYEATVEDPKTWTDTIVLTFPMAKVDIPLYETACHEGNYSMRNTLSGARAEEAAAKKP